MAVIAGEAAGQINALAEAGTPHVDGMIEHGSALMFPTVSLSSLVHAETPVLAFTETTDAMGTLCWLFKDQIIARVSQEIDAVADDKAALNEKQRSEMAAQIDTDRLLIERAECALIWHAEAKGEVIDWRGDTTPMALLGVRLVKATPADTSPGSSWMQAFDIVGGRGRR